MIARLLLSLAIAAPLPLAAAVASDAAFQRGVSGMNVTRVFHSGGGSFEQLDTGGWIEFGDEGTLIHQFAEERRDPGGVWLFDRSRGVRVHIDLARREIMGTPAFGRPRLLYSITDVDAGGRGHGWRGRRGGGGGGWNRGGRDDRGGGSMRGGTRDVEVGPIWNQADAERKCRAKAAELGGAWTGQWRTTVAGRVSVCEIRFR